MGMLAQTTYQQAKRAVLALAAALACAIALALACTLPAQADEVGTEGEDSFDLNLSMKVTDVVDPDAPVHPITVEVADADGAAVANAKVSYRFIASNPLYYIPPEDTYQSGVYAAGPLAAASGGMILEGQATTDASGKARVEGIVRGCDYEVRATAAGYAPYVSTHTCKGAGSEAWQVVMQKAPEQGEDPGGAVGPDGSNPPGSGGSGNTGGTGSSPGLGGLFPWLTKTGDGLLPWLLALSGAALAGFAPLAFARRKKDGADA